VPATQKPLSPSQELAQERLKDYRASRGQGKSPATSEITAQESAASRAVKSIVEGIPEAFSNPYASAPWADEKKTERMSETSEQKAQREALQESWEANKPDAEAQAALRMGLPEFRDKFETQGMSTEQINRIRSAREKLWNAARNAASANQRLQGDSTTTTVPSSLDKYFRPAGS